jgi:hypothetical protein
MVAASAAAILKDINCSTSVSVAPFGAVNSAQSRQTRRFGRRIFNRARYPAGFHTGLGTHFSGGNKGNVGNKVNDLKTTLAGKRPAAGDLLLTIA